MLFRSVSQSRYLERIVGEVLHEMGLDRVNRRALAILAHDLPRGHAEYLAREFAEDGEIASIVRWAQRDAPRCVETTPRFLAQVIHASYWVRIADLVQRPHTQSYYREYCWYHLSGQSRLTDKDWQAYRSVGCCGYQHEGYCQWICDAFDKKSTVLHPSGVDEAPSPHSIDNAITVDNLKKMRFHDPKWSPPAVMLVSAVIATAFSYLIYELYPDLWLSKAEEFLWLIFVWIGAFHGIFSCNWWSYLVTHSGVAVHVEEKHREAYAAARAMGVEIMRTSNPANQLDFQNTVDSKVHEFVLKQSTPWRDMIVKAVSRLLVWLAIHEDAESLVPSLQYLWLLGFTPVVYRVGMAYVLLLLCIAFYSPRARLKKFYVHLHVLSHVMDEAINVGADPSTLSARIEGALNKIRHHYVVPYTHLVKWDTHKNHVRILSMLAAKWHLRAGGWSDLFRLRLDSIGGRTSDTVFGRLLAFLAEGCLVLTSVLPPIQLLTMLSMCLPSTALVCLVSLSMLAYMAFHSRLLRLLWSHARRSPSWLGFREWASQRSLCRAGSRGCASSCSHTFSRSFRAMASVWSGSNLSTLPPSQPTTHEEPPRHYSMLTTTSREELTTPLFAHEYLTEEGVVCSEMPVAASSAFSGWTESCSEQEMSSESDLDTMTLMSSQPCTSLVVSDAPP